LPTIIGKSWKKRNDLRYIDLNSGCNLGKVYVDQGQTHCCLWLFFSVNSTDTLQYEKAFQVTKLERLFNASFASGSMVGIVMCGSIPGYFILLFQGKYICAHRLYPTACLQAVYLYMQVKTTFKFLFYRACLPVGAYLYDTKYMALPYLSYCLSGFARCFVCRLFAHMWGMEELQLQEGKTC